MLVPYRVNTLAARSPWANLALLAINVACFFLIQAEVISEDWVGRLILVDWSPLGLVGYQFVHFDVMHLIGNMLFLWVFGNAINGVLRDWEYLFVYLACGVLAGATHLLIDGHPAVGASGAVSGLLGLYLAIYPKNEITCFYWFFRPGSFDLKGYLLIIGWFILDVYTAVRGSPGIAAWAHVGGTVAGFGFGILLLKWQRVHLEEYDHPTILEIFAPRKETR